MLSNYKKLGDYIQPVNNRNKNLVDIPLLGVSIKKVLMPSIANIIGTDMSTYKLISKNQFAYGPVTSRNGDKISMALLEEHNGAMISQAYTVFEVIDEKKLLPEYLMMWFRRREFDRYARFKSHGSAREIFDWTEMCDTELPIPSPEKQQEIIREYNIIQNRIALNNQLITKLEETAQAIYKQWFVDFEFPDEKGRPYKSNGGEMVWCAELEKEIPEGWEFKSLTKEVKLSGGGTPDTQNLDFWKGNIPFFTPADIDKDFFVFKTEKNITENGLKGSSTKLYKKNTTFVTARGTVGSIAIAGVEMAMNQSCYAIIGDFSFYTHQLILSCMKQLKSEAIGAVFSALVTKDFDSQNIISPIIEIKEKFENKISLIYDTIYFQTYENQKLAELKELLLAKMTRVESGKVSL